jgi:tetratricopeptide (TPR) repeat protein
MKSILKWEISLIVFASAIAQSAPTPERPITRDEIDKKFEAVEKRVADKAHTFENRLAEKIDALEKRLAEKTDTLEKRGLELKLLEEKIDIKKDVGNSITEVRKDALGIAQSFVSWWLAAMAIILTLVGLIVPFFLFQQRKEFRESLAEVNKAAGDAEQRLNEIERYAKEVAALRDVTKARADDVEKNWQTVRTESTLHQSRERKSSAEVSPEVEQAALAVANSKEATLGQRLYALGVTAANKNEWQSASSYFAAACAENPSDATSFTNWGICLSWLAGAADGKNREWLSLEANSKFETALKIKPDKYLALENWGNSIANLAETSEGKDRERLWLETISKYEAALKIKPDRYETLDNWGWALLQLHHSAVEPARSRLLDEAEEKVNLAAKLSGVPSYNQACVAARRGNVANFIALADALPAGTLPDKKHIDTDNDLEDIRTKPEFHVWYARKFA